MKVTIVIQRSPEWVRAQRLETGDNTPVSIKVVCSVCELSHDARKVLLEAGDGYYQKEYDHVSYNSEYVMGTYFKHGCEAFYLDSDTPTAAEIDAAILAAYRKIQQARAAYLAEKKQEAAKEAAMKDARTLLQDELSALGRQVSSVRDDCTTLAKFLASMPYTQLEEALQRAYPQNAFDMQRRIEGASPVLIFDEDRE